VNGKPDCPRPGEKTVALEPAHDAWLTFIGHVETPWAARGDCPRQGDLDGPCCHLVLDPRWGEALTDIERHRHLQVLYWMDQARRDLVLLSPRSRPEPTGVFSLRAPTRPNPIASSLVALVERRGSVLIVRGLDCVDGTPLLDIKPHRGAV
jgi:tRNA-Thr(GGU) m(6)t(6)A37 methyltransferase TsaA